MVTYKLFRLFKMISLLYSVLCFIIIFILNELFDQECKQLFIYHILIIQAIISILLIKEDKYCIIQLKNKLYQSYMLLNDLYCKKKA